MLMRGMHPSKSIIGLLILLVAITIGSLVLFQQKPGASSYKPIRTPARVVQVSFTLAHEYKSLKELKNDAVLIVLGSVQTQKIVPGSHGVPYTISTLVVERMLKGNGSPTQTVLVRQPGGQTQDGIRWVSDEFPLLQVGTRYIIFLTPSPDPTVFYPVGAVQGVFTVNQSQQVNSLGDIGVIVKGILLETFVKNIQSA